MAFTFNRTDFVSGRDYNEAEHRVAMDRMVGSLINHTYGSKFDIIGNEIGNGAGSNNGLPFELGLAGEKETIINDGFIYIKTILNALGSVTSILQTPTEQINTANEFYFKIYEIVGGLVVNDFRFNLSQVADSNYVHVTGDEDIGGVKNFIDRPTHNGVNLAVEGPLKNGVNLFTGSLAVNASTNLSQSIYNFSVIEIFFESNGYTGSQIFWVKEASSYFKSIASMAFSENNENDIMMVDSVSYITGGTNFKNEKCRIVNFEVEFGTDYLKAVYRSGGAVSKVVGYY